MKMYVQTHTTAKCWFYWEAESEGKEAYTVTSPCFEIERWAVEDAEEVLTGFGVEFVWGRPRRLK